MIIEVWTKEKYSKNEEMDLIGRLSHAGVKPDFAKISRLYRVDGSTMLTINPERSRRIDADFEKKDFEKIAGEILIDPITEEYSVSGRPRHRVLAGRKPMGEKIFRVEVWLKDSVTDVVGESVRETISDVIGKKPENVRFGHAYYFSFNSERSRGINPERSRRNDSETRLKHAISKTLINELIYTNKMQFI